MSHDKIIGESYISVDIETSGPIPGMYSMLSFGACLVGRPDVSCYLEIQPISDHAVAEALAVSGLDLQKLKAVGRMPEAAMAEIRAWLRHIPEIETPIFVGFNAGFDWSFVNWYFHTFLGENPFGFCALDIKSFYMGLSGCAWKETTSRQLPPEFQPSHPATHNALQDAQVQAEIFQKMLLSTRHTKED